jgi:hypothetical protein
VQQISVWLHVFLHAALGKMQDQVSPIPIRGRHRSEARVPIGVIIDSLRSGVLMLWAVTDLASDNRSSPIRGTIMRVSPSIRLREGGKVDRSGRYL